MLWISSKGYERKECVKSSLRNSLLLLTLMYGSETWTRNRAQQSSMHAVEMSYLRGAGGVTRWSGENNENEYERCGMESHANGVNCGVVEWVKRNTMRRFGHTERMESDEFIKNAYVNEIGGPNSKGRPLGRWRERVKEYMCERGATRGGGLDQAMRECLDREVKTLLPWPPIWGMFSEKAMCQRYKL